MDKEEAKELLTTKLAEYRCLSYADVIAKIGDNDCLAVTGPTGVAYQIEVQFMWDGEPGGDVRVMGGIDDGGWRAFVPLCEDSLLRLMAILLGKCGKGLFGFVRHPSKTQHIRMIERGVKQGVAVRRVP